jgi:hypothetical protein
VLARLFGHAAITVSRQLRGHWDSGIPRHVIAAILAWDSMTLEQREAWVASTDREADKSD